MKGRGDEDTFEQVAVDERRHKKFLSNVASVVKSSDRKGVLDDFTKRTDAVSDDVNLLEGADKLKAKDLLKALKKSNIANLKKQLDVSTKRSRVLPLPLHRQANERISRSVAHRQVVAEVSKWEGVVKKNREADKLEFPLNQLPYKLKTVAEFGNSIEKKTALELETEKLLSSSKHNLTNKFQLTEAEKELMKAMSVAEANQRRKELQRIRALTSYQEAKFRRQKMIKSKKYRQIVKRQKRKQLVKDFVELQQKDPDTAREKLELLEADRIKERATLRHKNTGSWARQLRKHASKDPLLKLALEAQLRLGREITEKNDAGEEEKANEKFSSFMDLDSLAQLSNSEIISSNPWMQTSFLSKNNMKSDDASAITVEQFNQLRTHDLSCALTSSSSYEVSNNGGSITEKEQQLPEIHETGLKIEHSSLSTDASAKKTKKKRVQQCDSAVVNSRNSDHKTTEPLRSTESVSSESFVNIDRIFEALETSEHIKDIESSANVSVAEIPKQRKKRHRRGAENASSVAATKTPVFVASDNDQIQASSLNSTSRSSDKNIDPSDFLQANRRTTKHLLHVAPELIDCLDNEAFDHSNSQSLVAEAFAEDGVIDEFLEEKRVVEDSERAKDTDLTLPGWGEWTGPGAEVSSKKRKKHTVKAPTSSRRDRFMPGVIISETVTKSIRKLQVGDVPFPFTSIDEYESSIRHPLGKEWNTESGHKLLIEPNIVTKAGTKIMPMDKELMFKKRLSHNDSDGSDSD